MDSPEGRGLQAAMGRALGPPRGAGGVRAALRGEGLGRPEERSRGLPKGRGESGPR